MPENIARAAIGISSTQTVENRDGLLRSGPDELAVRRIHIATGEVPACYTDPEQPRHLQSSSLAPDVSAHRHFNISLKYKNIHKNNYLY